MKPDEFGIKAIELSEITEVGSRKTLPACVCFSTGVLEGTF